MHNERVELFASVCVFPFTINPSAFKASVRVFWICLFHYRPGPSFFINKLLSNCLKCKIINRVTSGYMVRQLYSATNNSFAIKLKLALNCPTDNPFTDNISRDYINWDHITTREVRLTTSRYKLELPRRASWPIIYELSYCQAFC